MRPIKESSATRARATPERLTPIHGVMCYWCPPCSISDLNAQRALVERQFDGLIRGVDPGPCAAVHGYAPNPGTRGARYEPHSTRRITGWQLDVAFDQSGFAAAAKG